VADASGDLAVNIELREAFHDFAAVAGFVRDANDRFGHSLVIAVESSFLL